VFRDMLHIPLRIVIAVPKDGSEVQPAHTSEAFDFRGLAFFGAACPAVIWV
jgi:hypothetical protein